MEQVFTYFALMILFVAGVVRVAVWSRRDSWVRHAVMAAFMLFIPASGLLAVDALGWNRPVSMAWRISGDFTVLGVKMVRGEGIYLYLDAPGEPRAVALPWDAEMAKKIQNALDDPRGRGLRFKYEWSWEYRKPPMVYPTPPPPLSLPKGESPEPPQLYEREA